MEGVYFKILSSLISGMENIRSWMLDMCVCAPISRFEIKFHIADPNWIVLNIYKCKHSKINVYAI